jgi:hypothetical protein
MSGVTILLDEVSPLLERVKTAAAARGLAVTGARGVGSLVRDHLYGLERQRHQYGKHYYRKAGDSVSARAVPQGAAVSITQLGLRQRLFGGPIVPVNAGALTIPACPEAVGHRAADFPHQLQRKRVLDPKTGSLRWALVRRASTAIRFRHRRRADGTVKYAITPSGFRDEKIMFWLVRRVYQKPDPTVLPSAEQMTACAVDAIKERLARLAQRQSAGDKT